MLSWKGPNRNTESNSWPCTGHPKNLPRGYATPYKTETWIKGTSLWTGFQSVHISNEWECLSWHLQYYDTYSLCHLFTIRFNINTSYSKCSVSEPHPLVLAWLELEQQWTSYCILVMYGWRGQQNSFASVVTPMLSPFWKGEEKQLTCSKSIYDTVHINSL